MRDLNIDAMRARQSRPSVARVYSYVLGGRDNYGVDKEVGDFFMGDLPGSELLAITNRQAMLRAARNMANVGITQIIDMGCGLPTDVNVHDELRKVHPDARVVYVDNDPFVVAHGRALLAVDDNIAVFEAEVGDPASIAGNPEVQRLIDFDQPVGIIFGAVLSFLEDKEDPAGVVRYWAERLAPDSRVYISHFRTGHTQNREAAATERKILEAFGRGTWRTDAEIEAMFGDLELLPPGVQPCAEWQPDASAVEHELNDYELLIVSGIARKA
ncbi:SAM-dependent methyltransferase [Nocardia yamanashiensis]|uniref:SAM-dependent methyltransferase n=1 Tax=Nocardia yamanashiensis TaxID=209247 RepID=UPI001E4CFF53|nr:SAM-dependent methyltransferase [Nocardia yamanashiensis]UGT43713.1 SAM-dependent methyltransferase [Nocardia yamanashiensis]